MADKILKCTKKKVYLDIVGPPSILSTHVLPTKADILRYYLYLKINAFETIINETLQIWNDARIRSMKATGTLPKIAMLARTIRNSKINLLHLRRTKIFCSTLLLANVENNVNVVHLIKFRNYY